MKISDGIKLKGGPVVIPDCGRDDLPEFFAEMGYKIGAEIGVYLGKFSKKLCQAGLKIYAVDPWLQYSDFEHPRGQKRLDSQYEQAKKALTQYGCNIIRKTSMEAVNDFRNESLDFVYIDGNHHFKYVAEDLCEWTKKVKVGGVIAGHDYLYPKPTGELGAWTSLGTCHVQYVVDAYTKACGIKNWYLLGDTDRSISWMWFKS